MRSIPIYFFLFLALFTKVLQAKKLDKLPSQNRSISFTENKGQFADQHYNPRPDVLFGGSDGQLTFHITNKGISYQLYKVDSYKEVEDPKTKEKRNTIDKQTIYRTDIKWLNTNQDAVVKTDEALLGYTNYYLEHCPNGALNVKSYKGITLQNIYTNINLHYYEKDGLLKYDYIVAPHADYKQIQLKVEGAILKLRKDGSLLIETPLGKIQEQAPLVYQNGRQLKARYTIKDNTIGFEIENYNGNYELIIDPVARIWGTYYGGTGFEYGTACPVDASGNVYLAGYTDSATGTIIATTGSHQSTNAGYNDAFLVKFNSSGVRQWSTYCGGDGNEMAYSAAIDASGNIYMAGAAVTINSTSTVMATAGSHQSVHGGGIGDAFLVKFNSLGVRIWGTYYGGAAVDQGNFCTTDASGNVYMGGQSNSTGTGTIIATTGSHQSIIGSGWDGFLVKFNSSGARQWATFYGGAGDDYGGSCAIDVAGDVYMAGATTTGSGTVIATIGTHQSSYGGNTDAFLVKFNNSGVRLWGTYYGGTGSEGGTCATDALGNVYLAGSSSTNSGTAIATPGSYQSVHSGGTDDAFLVKFNSSGIRQWASYYGDTGGDYANSCATDANGNVYMAGFTASSSGTGFSTPGSQQTYFGGGFDAFLVKFSSSGIRSWGTYYGSTSVENAYCCTTDALGNIYMTGCTESNTGTEIATAGSHQSTFGGIPSNDDAFLVKFTECTTPAQPSVISGTVTVCSGSSHTYSVSNDPLATAYIWNLPPGWGGISNTNTISAIAGSTGVFTLTATNPCTSPQQTLQVNVNTTPTVSVNSGSVCSGDSFIIMPSGADTYTITGNNFTVSPLTSSTYSVVGTNSAGCVSANVVSTVSVHLLPAISVNSGSMCTGKSFTIMPSGADTYTITEGNFTVSPNTTTSYSVTGTSTAGCVSSGNAVSTVTVNTTPTVSASSGSICSGNNFTIIPTGADSYSISGGTFIVSPGNTTTYSITGTSTAGCVSGNNAVSTISVNPTPTISVNNGSICNGDSFVIVPTGAATYTVSGGNYTVSPNTTSSYSVAGTTTAGCISTYAVSHVTVHALPVLTVNSGSICSGNSFTITPSGAHTFTITGGNFIVSPVTITSYSVTGTSAEGCVSSGNAVSTVSVNTAPTISVNSGSICSGNNFTITPSGALTYYITGGSFTVSPGTTTSYSVTGMSTEGCASSEVVSNVIVNATPILTVNSGSICLGESFVIMPSGADTYTITGGSFTVSPGITTSYSVVGMSQEGCVGEEEQSSVTVDICTGLNTYSLSQKGAVVYPNPSSGVVQIEAIHEAEGLFTDIQGRQLFKFNVSNGTNQVSIDHLSNGVYFLEIFHLSGKQVFRIVKQ